MWESQDVGTVVKSLHSVSHTHTHSLSPAHSTFMQRTRSRQVLHVTGQDFYSNIVFTSSWPHQQCDLCGRWSWCVDHAHAGCKTNQPSISTVIATHWSISELYTPRKTLLLCNYKFWSILHLVLPLPIHRKRRRKLGMGEGGDTSTQRRLVCFLSRHVTAMA